MFHRAVSGIEAYNLDPYFLSGEGLRSHLAAHAGEMSVIEGAMGYYDGVAATDEASAFTVAKETQTPVILIVSAKGVGNSLGAVIEGFLHYREDNQIQGIIFNDANESRYPDLKQIAESAGIRAYGYLPRKDEWTMPSRRLGLLTTNEIAGLQGILSELGRQAAQTVDIAGLAALAGTAPNLRDAHNKRRSGRSVRLAVARDKAFCFLYEENLELLLELGCELAFFSPISDRALPEDAQGLYLCGGYPELYAPELSNNTAMLASIHRAVERGMPTIAEGGGFLYLHDSLDATPMCGVIHGAAFETKHSQRFGYITITAGRDNMMCKAGESIRSHEFHYWDSSCPGDGFTARKAGREISYPCVHATDSLYAGFPHLFFPANPGFAEQFVERMGEFER